MIYGVDAGLALYNFFFACTIIKNRVYDFVNELLSRILTDGVNKKKWGIQQVKHSGKVNLFAGQTTGKIFIKSVNTVNKINQ